MKVIKFNKISTEYKRKFLTVRQNAENLVSTRYLKIIVQYYVEKCEIRWYTLLQYILL